jgi:TrwC relaxase
LSDPGSEATTSAVIDTIGVGSQLPESRHQGVLSDLLTNSLGWGWDGRARRHSEQPRFEVTGLSEALMAEFSQRSAAIDERKTIMIGEFVAAHGRQPTSVEVL